MDIFPLYQKNSTWKFHCKILLANAPHASLEITIQLSNSIPPPSPTVIFISYSILNQHLNDVHPQAQLPLHLLNSDLYILALIASTFPVDNLAEIPEVRPGEKEGERDKEVMESSKDIFEYDEVEMILIYLAIDLSDDHADWVGDQADDGEDQDANQAGQVLLLLHSCWASH